MCPLPWRASSLHMQPSSLLLLPRTVTRGAVMMISRHYGWGAQASDRSYRNVDMVQPQQPHPLPSCQDFDLYLRFFGPSRHSQDQGPAWFSHARYIRPRARFFRIHEAFGLPILREWPALPCYDGCVCIGCELNVPSDHHNGVFCGHT